MEIRLKFPIPLFIMIAAYLLIGCDAKKPAAPEKLQGIKVGSVPAIVEVPTHVAWEKGYFKETGPGCGSGHQSGRQDLPQAAL